MMVRIMVNLVRKKNELDINRTKPQILKCILELIGAKKEVLPDENA